MEIALILLSALFTNLSVDNTQETSSNYSVESQSTEVGKIGK